MMRRAALILALLASPSSAEVVTSDAGFVSTNSATVAAPPAEVWAALIAPARYWNPQHSYSGQAASMTLEARAGGCFCEVLADGGSVEHMRVVMVMPRRTLRLAGGLGPLQGEGLAGSLTWQLEAAEGGTRITQTYVVGGNMRMDRAAMAPGVDMVLREQLERLAALFPQRR